MLPAFICINPYCVSVFIPDVMMSNDPLFFFFFISVHIFIYREDVSERSTFNKRNEGEQEPFVHVYIGACLSFLE